MTFVTYEASRTGSPVMLLRLLRWLRAHSDLDLEVVCWRGGPLVPELRELAEVVVLSPAGPPNPGEILTVAAEALDLPAIRRRLTGARMAFGRRRQRRPDLVYVNGAPSLIALPYLGGAPVIAHIHELEFALGRSLAPDDRSLLGRPDRYLAVARVVADNLIEHHGVDPGAVCVQPGFVGDIQPEVVDQPDALRARLGIPRQAMIVGAVGDVIWRKGPDLFLQVPARVIGAAREAGEPDPHFVWVGGRPHEGMFDETGQDLTAMDLEGLVHFVGEQVHVDDWYRLFDLHVLTAREDPFPLVVLEAARAGLATVCFAAGGAPEFLVGPDGAAGVVVDTLDVAAMAGMVRALLRDKGEREALGCRGAERTRDHHVTSIVAPRILAEIDAALAPAPQRVPR